MTEVSAPPTLFCPDCGTGNLGTDFCEECGAAAPRGPVAVAPASAMAVQLAGTRAITRRALRVAFLMYALVVAAPAMLALALSLTELWNLVFRLTAGLTVALALGFAVAVTVAAATSSRPSGARTGAIALALTSAVLLSLTVFAPFVLASIFSGVALCAAFIAWALVAGFRGWGYFGLLVLVGCNLLLRVLSGAASLFSYVPNGGGLLIASSFVLLALSLGAIVLTVRLSLLFELRHAAHLVGSAVGMTAAVASPLIPVASVLSGLAAVTAATVMTVSVSVGGWNPWQSYDPYSYYDLSSSEEFDGDGTDTDTGTDTGTVIEEPDVVDPATLVLPSTCEELYSPSMRASLEDAGAVLNPSWFADDDPNGVAGTQDPTLYDLITPRSRLDCRWLASSQDPQWGIETTVAFLDADQAAAVGAALGNSGYRPLSELGGTRYVYEKTLTDGSGHYGESHIVLGNVWFATHWTKFGPTGYTADMVTQVFG